jgi:selenocysteine lyase/cysteine desulfurase
MAFSRKKFIVSSAASAAALLLPKFSFSKSFSSVASSDAEAASFSIQKDIVFLNNATMGPSPKVVIEAMQEGIADVTELGLYNRRRPEAVDNLSAFIGANNDEIVITHNCTEGINTMAWAVPLKAGDEVLISEQEHIGNAAPWLHRANLQKIVVKTVPLGNTAAECLQLIKKAITPKTKVFAFPHIPCTNGQVLPLKEICELAKQKNIITCIDGAHATGMMPLHLQQLGVDCYASCCHKWLLAAQGTGYLYIRKEMQAKLTPLYFGADGTQLFKTMNTKGLGVLTEKKDGIQRFAYGTQSGAAMASITAAVQFANNIGIQNIAKHGKDLSGYLQKELVGMAKDIQMLTPTEEKSRASIIAFKFKNKDNKKFFELMQSKSIIIRYVAENDINSIRVSTHIYNTKAQVEQLVKEIKAYLV